MATEVAQLPHLKVVSRVMELPIVELAFVKSAETYSRVKGSHQLMNWALSTAESSLSTATRQAMPIAVPIAKRLESPINFVDHTLCLGLDKIEEKVPLVKEKPAQILEKAVSRISHVNDLILQQATNLRDISWNTANHILETRYGSVAVRGIDNTAVAVDKLIDRYFPATEEEKPQDGTEINAAEEDKLLHTLQTVGHLSNKAARRVYLNIVNHLRTIKKDALLNSYVSSLVEFLHLTKYIHTVNEKPYINGAKKEVPQEDKEKNE
ncbi:PREDICTED: lipid storage droplets surface-binding protein 2-like [Vollenhovia emeryi]|uniref:lipid storage droplets surface-binding protein 2-like n=1 Tax=Vollenhovia emeryi TaxID=411798 RepID=UPI0005F4A5FA|nr:PREDICTED: lipid storage droplets surface-binding protein 2-like [Vollenhovia emeryi]XP_011878381.1 PREDICTED: lipid storage droplets surface-binding protein 2-like [Vollenhovia emeryi]